MNQRLRIGVIGAGVMGQNHINTLQKNENIHFVGAVESDLFKRDLLEKEKHCRIYSLEEIKSNVDAVIIATPSSSHYETGKYFLSQGIHCLIEKPLALTIKDCDDLTTMSQKKGAQLMVGHIEEFNPGFLHLKELLKNDKDPIISMDFSRVNHGSNRITDTNVVLDLMIHDIGCAFNLLIPQKDKCRVLNATHIKNNGLADISKAVVSISNTLVSFTANRISHKRERLLTVNTKNHCYELNFINQNVITYQHGSSVNEYKKEWASPLENELTHFIECINSNTLPMTSGEHGLRVMELATSIISTTN